MDGREFLELWWRTTLGAAAAALPVFAAVFLVTLLGRRLLAPWVRHALWTLVLVRLLLPASVPSPVSVQSSWRWLASARHWLATTERRASPHGGEDAFALSMKTEPSPTLHVAPPAPATPVSLFERALDVVAASLPSACILGSLFVALWTVATSLRMSRRVRRGPVCTDAGWLALLAEGRRQWPVGRPVTLRVVPGLRSPATIGWLRPAILLPADAANLSADERRHVIWHELAHIRRGDAAWNWLLAAARVLQWWNPLFWWTQQLWLAERELASDALALQRLGAEQTVSYGRTLLRVAEGLADRRVWFGAVDVPGFVPFLADKTAFRRRLQQLPELGRAEGRWRRRCAWGLLLALVVTGLTDAGQRPRRHPRESRLGLPADTVWRVSTGGVADDGPRLTVAYDLSAAIQRVRQDDPERNDDAAALGLQQTVTSLLQAVDFAPSATSAETASAAGAAARCVLRDQKLIVQATRAEHEAIQQLLSRIQVSGERQVAITLLWLSTPQELSDLLPTAGGEVIAAAPLPLTAQGSASAESGAALRAAAFHVLQMSVPAFVRVLQPSETARLTKQAQADPRSNLLAAPKITMFDGMTATVSDLAERPFVTGLQSLPNGQFQPQVTLQPEGLSLQLHAEAGEAPGQTRLRVRYRRSELLDVEMLKFRSTSGEVAVQSPQVSESVVDSSAALAAGQTLLLAPLRRDRQGNLHLCLITPQWLATE